MTMREQRTVIVRALDYRVDGSSRAVCYDDEAATLLSITFPPELEVQKGDLIELVLVGFGEQEED